MATPRVNVKHGDRKYSERNERTESSKERAIRTPTLPAY